MSVQALNLRRVRMRQWGKRIHFKVWMGRSLDFSDLRPGKVVRVPHETSAPPGPAT